MSWKDEVKRYGLGEADDDPQILLEAASYLKKWKMKFMFGE